MKLASTISWSAFATIIRLANGFISIKIIAVVIGPVGVALIGQFNNFTQIVMTLALGGVSSGIVKYTSEFKNNSFELRKIWCSITFLSGVLLMPITIFLIIFHNWIAKQFLHDIQYGFVILIFAIMLVFYVANTFLLNILNGLHEIKQFNMLNAFNSILGLCVSIVLVYQYKIWGALLSLVSSQSITFFMIVFFVRKKTWFYLANFFGKADRYYLKKLLGYTAMSLTSVCIIPTSQIFVRTFLTNSVSWDVAGCWQAVQKISDAYLMIIYAALGTYFLPKYASLNSKKLIDKEIANGMLLIVAPLCCVALLIYVFRDFIIVFLFTKKFLIMGQLILWQLLGDVFRVLSYFFTNLVHAKAKIRIHIISEIFFGAVYVLSSYFFILYIGAAGSTLSFLFTYFIFFIFFLILFKRGVLY